MKQARLIFALAVLFVVGSSFAGGKATSLEKLMKQMLAYIKAERVQIENNKPALAFPISQQQVSKAKVHGQKASVEHQMYVNDFFETLTVYQQTKDSAQRTATYNTMVNSCINCHRHECPGPVTVIKKSLF